MLTVQRTWRRTRAARVARTPRTILPGKTCSPHRRDGGGCQPEGCPAGTSCAARPPRRCGDEDTPPHGDARRTSSAAGHTGRWTPGECGVSRHRNAGETVPRPGDDPHRGMNTEYSARPDFTQHLPPLRCATNDVNAPRVPHAPRGRTAGDAAMGDDDTRARHTRRQPPDMPRFEPGAFERTLRRVAEKPPPPRPRIPEELRTILTRTQWWELGLPTQPPPPKPAHVTVACGNRSLYTQEAPPVGQLGWCPGHQDLEDVVEVEPVEAPAVPGT